MWVCRSQEAGTWGDGSLVGSGHWANHGAMTSNDTPRDPHPYVGMWVTADGYIRQELLPNGRYDEARGNRQSAYTGRYTVTGNHIDYVDDIGFTATGDIRDGILFHEHLVLYREGDDRARQGRIRSRD
ncbi:putative ligand-binding protein with streptavidin-like fold [Streptomyces sp. TLI_235]|nr:putative ligand-binding protein with streptavidin-like fold [Streptomyces sp. TLI_235]